MESVSSPSEQNHYKSLALQEIWETIRGYEHDEEPMSLFDRLKAVCRILGVAPHTETPGSKFTSELSDDVIRAHHQQTYIGK